MTDRYQKNADRPAPSSVANVEVADGVDAHDPFGEAPRLAALESGDAWVNKTTGYVPVVQGDGSVAWEAASGGGGADLSAVDQDVVILNGHVVSYVGVADDDEGQQNVGWDSDLSAVVQKGDLTAGGTSAVWVDPFNAGTRVSVSAGGGQARVMIESGGGFGGIVLNATGIPQFIGDHGWSYGGPVLKAPDDSLHRLVVASDGSLSTEPVV